MPRTTTTYRYPVMDLELAFQNGRRLPPDSAGLSRKIVVKRLGELALPSGEIVVADAGGLDAYAATRLAGKVKPGTYPIDLSLRYTTEDDEGDEEADDDPDAAADVAGLRLLLEPGATIASWQIAPHCGDDLADLRPFEAFAFEVHSGLAAIADAAALKAAADRHGRQKKSLDDHFYFEKILPALENPNGDGLSALVPLDPASGGNLVVCASGYGDGRYPAYWGYDQNGEPVCLVIEFGLFLHEVRASRSLGALDELIEKVLVLDLPCGETQIKARLVDRRRRLIVELSGYGEAPCGIELRKSGKKLVASGLGGSSTEQSRSIELHFREALANDVVLELTYPDHIESLLE